MIIKRSSIVPFAFDSLQIYDYTAGAHTSSSLAIVRVSPGGRHREAWSRCCDKYYYVLEGSVEFIVNGGVSDVDEGDCCIVRQGQHFWYRNRTQRFATLLVFHTPPFDLQAEVFVDE